MITQFDDYCIHQTAEPVNRPGSSDRNFYDRYWANGFAVDGGYMFEMALGLYPNRRVMDAHFSILIDGVQHCFHASRRAPQDRADCTVGPLHWQILKPLRSFRLHLEANATGVSCDLLFSARSHAAEEPRSTLYDDGRLIMDTTRYTQVGCWQGHILVHGRRVEVAAGATRGARDKSWGIRPVGEPEGGAPSRLRRDPRVYWIWAPLDFGDFATQFNTFEESDGQATQLAAHMAPAYDDPAAIPAGDEPAVRLMATARHRISWVPGTRRAASAEVDLMEGADAAHQIAHHIVLTPLLTFHVAGIGYHHPTWAHGIWKGEEVIEAESWVVAQLDPLAYPNIHVHQMVRATLGDRIGYGTLETLCFGRHDPSGFTAFLDGAA